MMNLDEYFPKRVNTGKFLPGYTFNELEKRIANEKVALPVCSLGTPADQLAFLAPLVLPPLYHEAMDEDLRERILNRILLTFPYYAGTKKRMNFKGNFSIRECVGKRNAPPDSPKILAFSVDTAVEEHGPHLPLGTDTLQSYAVLNQLAKETDDLLVGPPVEYGQLTWGLPFGLSVDLTAPLLTRYVRGFVNAVMKWIKPAAIYVVDVHGSIVHRTAIQEGLKLSDCKHWAFRWLHEPLTEFAGDRGDQHAGGVETALIHHINPELVDARWWPDKVEELALGQTPMVSAIELSGDLSKFIDAVEKHPLNGIVGNIRNFFDLDAELLMNRMMDVAREDVTKLSASV
ncbi:MAG: creatinine amidohydrolase [Candidatus Binatia bacterium]|jgi:creatinine amidohydrolase